MNLAEFEDLIDRCGELPAAWPDEIRADALKLLGESREAQDVVAEAAALRQMFDSRPAEPAPVNLANRIVTLVGRVDDLPAPLDRDKVPKAPGRVPFLSRSSLPKSYVWIAACFVAGVGFVVRGLLK